MDYGNEIHNFDAAREIDPSLSLLSQGATGEKKVRRTEEEERIHFASSFDFDVQFASARRDEKAAFSPCLETLWNIECCLKNFRRFTLRCIGRAILEFFPWDCCLVIFYIFLIFLFERWSDNVTKICMFTTLTELIDSYLAIFDLKSAEPFVVILYRLIGRGMIKEIRWGNRGVAEGRHLSQKIATICCHSAFAWGHGMTTGCDAIGISNCELGKPTATSSSAAKRTGRLNGTPGKKL